MPPDPDCLRANREKIDPRLRRRLEKAAGCSPPAGTATVRVIVQLAHPRYRDESVNWPAKLQGMGGRYRQPLPLINGFSASLPLAALAQLLAIPKVARVSSDVKVRSIRT